VITEVRIYRITPGELDAFVDEWRAHVVPLRRRFGFEVTSAWASLEDDTFVWVLAYDGDDWESAERAYYDSRERRLIDPDPARHVAEPSGFRARPVRLP
jgi:hypothetical protein